MFYDDGDVSKFQNTTTSLTDHIGAKFKVVNGYKKYRVFSDMNYETNRGIVRLYYDLLGENE